MEKMKCVVKKESGKGRLLLTEQPAPTVGASDILVKVLAAAVCGTDVHIEEWNDWAAKRLHPPVVIGHEFAGEVVAVGKNVTNIKVGDIVSAETHIVCNTCEICRNGHQHVCSDTKVIGVSRDGCFAQYISFPAENAFVCDQNLPVEVLSLMEPFGAAVHACMEFPIASKTVAVAGCGPIGVMAVAVARKIGAAKVIAVEPNEKRGALAKEMGADVIVNPIACDPVKTIKEMTDGKGVDVLLEISGNIPAIKAALLYLKPEGKIAALGLPSSPIDFDFSEFVYRGLTLKGIAGRKMYETWEQMKGLLANGLDLSKVVTHVLPLERYQEGLDLMRKGECCKTILKPWA